MSAPSRADLPGDLPLVTVALGLGAHGVAGEIRARILSDVSHRFEPGRQLYFQGQPRLILSSAFRPPDRVILKLAGVDTAAQARACAGQEILAAAEDSPHLPEGEYFHYQLMGLRVVTEEGEFLGQVTEIIETGSNDVYVVRGPAEEVLLPALAQVIRAVDLAAGTMTVRLLEGLR